jgi:predicted enzyme related to lactoylglutathione lyase
LRLAITLVFMGVVTAGVMNAQSHPQNDPLDSLRPYLVGISVPNADQAATWYEQKLGFKSYGAAQTPDGTTAIVVERGSFAVELLQYKDSFSIRRFQPQYNSASGKLQGISKFAFAVNDLEAALAQLKRQGVHIVREITDVKGMGVSFFLIEDNNGNVIQIFQAGRVNPPTEGEPKR